MSMWIDSTGQFAIVYLYIYNSQYIGQTCSCILFICANFATTAFSLSKLEFNFTFLTYGKDQLQRNIHTQISAPLWQMNVAKNLEQGRAFVWLKDESCKPSI